MLYPESREFSEEFISIKPRVWYGQWYWLLVLWIATVGIFTIIGYYTSGAGASSKLLAAMGEAWSNMFAREQSRFVEVIDTHQFSPQATFLREPDRVFTGSTKGSGAPEVAGVAVGQEVCDVSAEVSPARNGVIINEVAWMGGLAFEGLDSRDEWIELKNISSSQINIGGWRLSDDDGQINVVFPASTLLAPGSFYLLERADDGSVPQITADLLYKGSLSNEDDGLRFFDTGCQLEDEVLADPNWLAGNATQRRTMERGPDLTWHTFSGPVTQIILGTPKAENSEPIVTAKEEKTADEKDNCSLENLGRPSHKALINEVAWAGMSGNASGEWIELYYPGRTGMSLAGWQLLDAEESIAIHFGESDFMDEYFLMRRILTTEDPALDYDVAGKKVDKAYTGVVQNSDESLYLFNADCELVDKISGVGTNWKNIGGTASPDYRTAERTDENKWHTYSGSGKDDVMGTPRAVNSKSISDYKEPVSSSGGGGGSSPKPEEDTVDWCIQSDLATSTRAVFINEVAWAGSASSTSAEWIELFAPSDEEISLAGWQLQDKDGEIKIAFGENDKLNDYFLLTRILTSDDFDAVYTIGGVTTDKVYTGVIQNESETIRLFDASCNLVDEVIDVGSNWSNVGGTASPDYRTAERVDKNSWQTYIGDGANGVMGTPRAENSKAESPPEDENPPDGGEEPPPDEENPPEEDEEADLTSLQITEIIFDVDGADDGLERVVVSNSTSTNILIETLSLQYLRMGGDLTAIKKKNFGSGNTVPAGGDFIVGMSCSTATPCEGVDMSWSQSLANDGGTVYLVRNQEVVTDDNDADILHKLSYGGG